MKEINEEMLNQLREQVMGAMSQKRFRHTVAVEDMAARLCALFCPEHTLLMRAAALLHDLTKELKPAEQVVLCHAYGLSVTDGDRLAPKTFHARTAAAKIEVDFPQEMREKLDTGLYKELFTLLENDPRPSYKKTDEKEYGMKFSEYEIFFRVVDGVLHVTRIEGIVNP